MSNNPENPAPQQPTAPEPQGQYPVTGQQPQYPAAPQYQQSQYPVTGQQPQYPVTGQQPQYQVAPAQGQQQQYPVPGQQPYYPAPANQEPAVPLPVFFKSWAALLGKTPTPALVANAGGRLFWLWALLFNTVISALAFSVLTVLGGYLYNYAVASISRYVPAASHYQTDLFLLWLKTFVVSMVFFAALAALRSALNMAAVKMRGGQISYPQAMSAYTTTAAVYSVTFMITLLPLLLTGGSAGAAAMTTILMLVLLVPAWIFSEIAGFTATEQLGAAPGSILLPYCLLLIVQMIGTVIIILLMRVLLA